MRDRRPHLGEGGQVCKAPFSREEFFLLPSCFGRCLRPVCPSSFPCPAWGGKGGFEVSWSAGNVLFLPSPALAVPPPRRNRGLCLTSQRTPGPTPVSGREGHKAAGLPTRSATLRKREGNVCLSIGFTFQKKKSVPWSIRGQKVPAPRRKRKSI